MLDPLILGRLLAVIELCVIAPWKGSIVFAHLAARRARRTALHGCAA